MKGSRRTSLRDIAQASGVGRTAVSLALRDDRRLPLPTRQRIQEVARRMGYAPNPLVSRVMAMHRSTGGPHPLGTLGFLTAYPTREGWRNATSLRYHDGAVARAAQLGYRLEVFWTREPGMTGRRMTTVLRTRGIEGLILAALPRAVGHLSLEWPRFAVASLGYTTRRPALHRAVHHHFEAMAVTLRLLLRRGYRRIGLALDLGLDERVHHLWRAGFLVHQDRLRQSDRIPVLLMRKPHGQEFPGWFERHHPEAIIGSDPIIVEWLHDLGQIVPDDVGFAHLDWSKHLGGIAGIDQNSEVVGATAVDLVVNQLHRGERGIPTHPKVVLIEGRWTEGSTVRDMKRTATVPRSLTAVRITPSPRRPSGRG